MSWSDIQLKEFQAFAFNEIPVSDEWSLQALYFHEINILNLKVMIICMGATDIALDLAVLSLPVPMIKRLHLSAQKKVLLVGTFWLGAL